MPYIDLDYYENDYKGTPVDAESFNRLSRRASEQIDTLTHHRLIGTTLDQCPELIQNCVKKATAAQVEYLVMYGEEKAMGAGDYTTVRAGNFSYGGAGDSATSREQSMYSESVKNHLIPTGLMYAGVDVYDIY